MSVADHRTGTLCLIDYQPARRWAEDYFDAAVRDLASRLRDTKNVLTAEVVGSNPDEAT